MCFSAPANLLLPGRGVNMGDGWETRRRRGPGHDWCVIRLGCRASVEAVEIDTAHFRGNYPDRAAVEAIDLGDVETRPAGDADWSELVSPQKLGADAVQRFDVDEALRGPWTHVRLVIHPDGGVSRLRIWGRPVEQPQ